MTWPTDNKADESKLANDTDQISQARREIEQNVDNTNAIIDHFDLSTISEGDVIQYVSGQWQVVANAGINSTTFGTINFNSDGDVSTGGASNIFTTDSTGTYLVPGQYIIHSINYMRRDLAPTQLGDANTFSFTIGSKTFSYDSVCYEGGNSVGVQRNLMSGVISTTTNQAISTSNGNRLNNFTIFVYKIA